MYVFDVSRATELRLFSNEYAPGTGALLGKREQSPFHGEKRSKALFIFLRERFSILSCCVSPCGYFLTHEEFNKADKSGGVYQAEIIDDVEIFNTDSRFVE